MDWHQLWKILSAADNVPIAAIAFLVPFYTWYGFREARRNDKLIKQLEADPALAKTHHRKHQPYHPDWDKTVHVWPYLLRIEFLAAVLILGILTVWSICLDAPLEEPANPNLTMNPSKAPWYFLGLQELLVYFDPWIAGVVLPGLIIGGLIAIPYIDVNPLGNGYYTWSQRKFAITTFSFGWLILWILLIFIGTFIRGPGWMWFWPGQTWDHHRLVFEVNQDLDSLLGIHKDAAVLRFLFGGAVTTAFCAAAGLLFHKWFTKKAPEVYARLSLIQYGTLQFFMVIMMSVPVKIILRLAFRIKYVWVTPWFNI